MSRRLNIEDFICQHASSYDQFRIKQRNVRSYHAVNTRTSHPTVPATTASPPPIHKLPAELLGYIFEQYICVENYPETILNGRYKPSKMALTTNRGGDVSPVILGHICSHWRIVTLSMPTLWSSLAIDSPKLSHIPMVKLWLERAAHCPLSLSLTQAIDRSPEQTLVIQRILPLLLNCSSRWKSIRFSLGEIRRDWFDTLFSKTLQAPRLLESALLIMPYTPGPEANMAWKQLYSSPALRRIAWCPSQHLSPSVILGSVRWGQVTHVEMLNTEGFTINEFLTLLRSCKKLIQLMLCVSELQEPGEVSSTVTLPNLRTLHLQSYGSTPSALLSRVDCPKLRSLRLIHGCRPRRPKPASQIPFLRNFLFRSNCKLEIFSILYESFISEYELLGLLELPNMQSLKGICLGNGIVTDALLLPLSRRTDNGRPRLLPSLSVFFLPRCQPCEGTILKMVNLRVPTLRAISMSSAEDDSYPKDWTTLEALKARNDPLYMSLEVIRK